MKVVIMAGGKGTRLNSLNSQLPKPLIDINNKPILLWQIETLKRQGFNDIIITIGFLGEKIRAYFGDGTKFGVNITYFLETEPLGTAGSLFKLYNHLSENFILINGDLVFDVDFSKMIQFHYEKNSFATILTHPNNHPFDSSIIIQDYKSNIVLDWLNKEDNRIWYRNLVNSGIHILKKQLFNSNVYEEFCDLDRNILKPLVKSRKLFSYTSPEYVKDVGTPDRFYATENDLKNGLVKSSNLTLKQKAAFFDRDGTINIYKGFLRNIDDFELIPEIDKVISKYNDLGYIVIVITNQPVIARGEVTWTKLNQIHNKMETLLGKKGAYINDIFICPHHPDSGFEGEIKKYKKTCNCRKPKSGLFLSAQRKYNIDFSSSVMFGDSESDEIAARSVGIKEIFIKKSKNY
jgi:D-glycero-D-manno-heptose 1,7-bisphosphate phosphatase